MPSIEVRRLFCNNHHDYGPTWPSPVCAYLLEMERMKDMKARLSTKMIGESLPLTVVVAVALLSGALLAVSRRKLWVAHPVKRGEHIK